jgi:hypothetical protein
MILTKEQKKLLLDDLCARLPYGVRGTVKTTDGNGQEITDDGIINSAFINEHGKAYICIESAEYELEDVKPYLRTMSSMTVEEEAQVHRFMDIVTDENYGDGYSPSAWDAMNGFVQYCDSHHLDHRGLIFRGLALEAPEGMYNDQMTAI